MRKFPFVLFLLALLATSHARADAPKVVTDILPVHSLVSQIMEGVGTPSYLVSPNADPHNTSMRPSQAASLAEADVVFLIGTALTPWLEGPLEALAGDAQVVSLLGVEGTKLLHFRGGHGHDHDDDTDPHAWLDVGNARLWLGVIATTLAMHDPENAKTYQANAKAAQSGLDDLRNMSLGALQSVGPYGVHHDAFQYFEAWFNLQPAFVIKEDDAHQPGAARIAKLRARVRQGDIACVFVEPAINLGLVETVLEGTDTRILELDPLGADLEPGSGLFPQVLSNMAKTMSLCQTPLK